MLPPRVNVAVVAELLVMEPAREGVVLARPPMVSLRPARSKTPPSV